MATKFLEPGGDATFGIANSFFWQSIVGSVAVATDFVHSTHVKSISFAHDGAENTASTPSNTANDAGRRLSLYVYLSVKPTDAATRIVDCVDQFSNRIFFLKVTTGGVLQLFDDAGAQMGSNGATLSTGVWYRLCIAYVISSGSVNDFKLFVDGVSSISVHNATLGTLGSNYWKLGNPVDTGMVLRISDIYVDDDSGLTDTGDVYVTAKRPNANGTTNGFSTQIGSGGSGYGTGHSPQVNERPNSDSNGWSMIGAGSAVTEEYNIEGVGTGDMNITGKTIVDYIGWVRAKALASETGSIIVNGVTNNIGLTSTTTVFTQAAGSTTYPAGTGADIGIITTTALTTVSLYECGIMVAFIGPPAAAASTRNNLTLMGVT